MASVSGQQDAYGTVVREAGKEGFAENPGINWPNTLGIMGLVWISTAWAMYSTLISGEVKRASNTRQQLLMMLTPYIVGTVWLAVTSVLLESTMGAKFLHSIGFLIFNGSPLLIKFPATPYFWLLVGILSHNGPLITLLYLGFVLAIFQYLVMTALGATRVMLAATFDRLLPEKVADISPRYNSPVIAIAIFFVAAFIWTVIYNYTTLTPYVASAEFVSLLAFMGTCLAAVVLPYRMPELYQASPMSRLRILGLPVMTAAGLVGLVFNSYLLYLYVAVPGLFANSPTGLIVVFGIYAVVLVYYLVRRYYLRSQGVRPDLAFSTIPPE
jgi:amino acid transporter